MKAGQKKGCNIKYACAAARLQQDPKAAMLELQHGEGMHLLLGRRELQERGPPVHVLHEAPICHRARRVQRVQAIPVITNVTA